MTSTSGHGLGSSAARTPKLGSPPGFGFYALYDKVCRREVST